MEGIEEAGGKKQQEFQYVLVHGLNHGAWCWYKLMALLKTAGHKVTALDMTASGVNLTPIEQVSTFQHYTKPLLDFMASVDADSTKVILVGHSLGGLNLAFAMDHFPHKISAAVFVTAFVPDTFNQPSFVLDKFVESIPEGGWLDTQLYSYGSSQSLTAMLLGPQFLRFLYSHSPIQDFELVMSLRRPGSFFLGDLSKAKKLSKEGYGSVRRIYIISKEDKGITEEFARWMIENSGVEEVKEIEGADHMTMLSQPQRLCDCLLEIPRF